MTAIGGVARPHVLKRPVAILVAAAVVLATLVGLAASAALLLPATQALFAAERPVEATVAAARIFRDDRVTPAFSVVDRSSGASVDASSSTAFSIDGLYFLTREWPASFDGDRYIELDLNGPLPAGLSVSDGTVSVSLASDAAGGQACWYAQLRHASNGALVSTHGSSGSPLDCVTGTAPAVKQFSIPTIDLTDLANDLRLRIYARDSLGGAIRLDAATAWGEHPYASFTLYPIQTREAFDGQTELIRWGLAGP